MRRRLHGASIARRGSAPPDRRLGGRARCGSRRAAGGSRGASTATEDHVFRWASVTKLATALATLVAVEEGVVDLDEPAGPEGSTVRHLLAHASGLPFDAGPPISAVRPTGGSTRTRASTRSPRTSRARPRCRSRDYLAEAVFRPLGMDAELRGDAAGADVHGTLARRGRARRASCSRRRSSQPRRSPRRPPSRSPASTACCPTTAASTRWTGASASSCKDDKAAHWSGTLTSPRTFGHFGGSGTFLWVDPDRAARRCVVLTDRRVRRLVEVGLAGALGRATGGSRAVAG